MIVKKKSNFGITVESTDVYRKKKTTRHIINRVLYFALVHTRQMGAVAGQNKASIKNDVAIHDKRRLV